MAVTDQDKLTPQVAGESKSGGPKRLAVDDDGKTYISPEQIGEVQETPTAYTLLRRLKDLLTGVVLAAGTAIIGKIRLVTAIGDEITDDTLDAVNVAVKNLLTFGMNLFEWTSSTYIATQALTVDGVQWSDEKTIAAGGAETQVFGAIIEPPKSGTLVAVQLGLTAQMKSSAATQAKSWQWKARNKAGTWVNLHSAVSENLTTAYVEKYRSGVFFAIANINQVPLEIGLFGTPSADESFICQVKGSSMGTLIYKPS